MNFTELIPSKLIITNRAPVASGRVRSSRSTSPRTMKPLYGATSLSVLVTDPLRGRFSGQSENSDFQCWAEDDDMGGAELSWSNGRVLVKRCCRLFVLPTLEKHSFF